MNHFNDASKEVKIAIDGIMRTRAAEASSAHSNIGASSHIQPSVRLDIADQTLLPQSCPARRSLMKAIVKVLLGKHMTVQSRTQFEVRSITRNRKSLISGVAGRGGSGVAGRGGGVVAGRGSSGVLGGKRASMFA
ncbi:hypothetical protein Droror1_Dr00003119 [Drosera rotundifolia]